MCVTGQCCMSLIGVLGSCDRLITGADIWLTISLLQSIRKRPGEQNWHFFRNVRLCHLWLAHKPHYLVTSVLPELAQPDVPNFVSLLLSFQRIVVKKYSRSESSIQTKSR